MNTSLRIRKRDWITLTTYLLSRKDVESGAYALVNLSTNSNGVRFLIKQIVIPTNSDYISRTSVEVALSPAFTESAFAQCEESGSHLLDIHTHPWSDHQVEFSSIDDREAVKTKAPYIRKFLPWMNILFIVFGSSEANLRARYFNHETGRLEDISRIVII